MAFDLKAILRLEDRFSDPMRRIEKATARTQKAMNSLGSSTSTANRHHINLGSSVGKLTKGFGGLTGALAGTAAAYLSIGAAQKLFSETVGAAAQKQQSEVVIGAMFNDKQLSKQYISMIDKLSVASPVLNSQDVYGSSKGYISTTKNVKQLEKMWGLTERLVALDPAQGVEGATLALKELFSNDSTSIIERFEMPRKVMNEIKKLPLDKQLSALDNYFNKIGATTKLIDDMGGTAIGMWSRVREQFSLLLSDMGQPSLQVVSKFLTDVLSKLENGDLNRFRDVGARWIKNILTGLTNGIMNVYNWFNALTTSQQWKDATTLSAKVNIIIDDLLSRFNNWYEASGKKHLETMTESLTKTMADSLIANSGPLAEAALTIGGKIAASLQEGIWNGIKDNFILNAILTRGAGVSTIGFKAGQDWAKDFLKAPPTTGTADFRALDEGKSHNGGLDFVPYDGYKISAHRGEKILSRGEAREYRNGKGGVTIGSINLNYTGTGNTREDAKKLLDFIADEIELAGGAGA